VPHEQLAEKRYSFLTPINDGSRHNAARERPYRHRMGGLRQGSFAVRAAISVLALYALVLQALLVSSTPSTVFAFPGGIDAYNCSQDATGSGVPSGHPSHHHGLCCILACAAAACAYVGTATSIAVFLAIPEGAKIDFASAPRFLTRPALKYFFAARGPPQDL
jgi:hypothetical protein